MSAAIALAFVRTGDLLLVLGSPSGSLSDLRPLGTFRPDWQRVHEVSANIAAACRLADNAGEMADTVLQSIRRQGAWLFDELVPFEAKAWLRRHPGNPITLSLDPDLMQVPFELMHTGEVFLAERWPMGRTLQGEYDPGLRRALPARDVRVHIIADPDGTLDEAWVEGDAILRRLQRHPRVQASMRAGDVDPDHLRSHLHEIDILHFAGHMDDAGFRMADAHFDATMVRRLAGAPTLPLLVVANGCRAVQGGDDPLLLAWLAAGVRHVVGPLHALPDRLGLLFAEAFYRELLAGQAIGVAVLRARQAVARQVGPGTIPWGAYVLYGDPSTVYFTAVERPKAAEPAVTRLAVATERPAPEMVRSAAVESPPAGRTRLWRDPVVLLLAALVLLTALACGLISGADLLVNLLDPTPEFGPVD